MDYKSIIDLIKRKDKAGLEALYNTYGQKFYSYAVKRWNLSEDSAWDVVYQTLETLVLKLPGYDFESKTHFDNFIFKVFTNFLRQYYRKHRQRQMELPDSDILFGTTINDVNGNGEENILLIEKFESNDDLSIDKTAFIEYYETDIITNPKLIALKKALAVLDEEDRDILLLRAQDFTYDEIAHMLKIENKQLKVRHHRIKAKLISIMNKNSLLDEKK